MIEVAKLQAAQAEAGRLIYERTEHLRALAHVALGFGSDGIDPLLVSHHVEVSSLGSGRRVAMELAPSWLPHLRYMHLKEYDTSGSPTFVVRRHISPDGGMYFGGDGDHYYDGPIDEERLVKVFDCLEALETCSDKRVAVLLTRELTDQSVAVGSEAR